MTAPPKYFLLLATVAAMVVGVAMAQGNTSAAAINGVAWGLNVAFAIAASTKQADPKAG